MSDGISTPKAEEASDETVVSPNAVAKRNSALLWASVIAVACVLGGAAVYTTIFPSEPSAAAKRLSKEDAKRIQGTASVASGVPISPSAENAQLKADRADVDARLRQLEAENAALVAEKESLNARNLQDREDAYQMIQAERTRSGSTMQSPTKLYESGAADDAGFSPKLNPASSTSGDGLDAGPKPLPKRVFKTVSYQSGATTIAATTDEKGVGNGGKAGAVIDRAEVFDPGEYVPPNSYATAKVLVGVDMQTGVGGTADPKPVLFRIKSPAVGVGINGKYQTSQLTGCTVNGAAYAELSSERVYVKLQRITCEGPNGRFLTSPVEGYVTYKGKTGIRGNVVRREGDYAGKAFVAGTFQGLGKAMERNVQNTISGVGSGDEAGGTIINTRPLTGSEIARATAGSGVSGASGMLADYYIKRAEQYQPVIEMPTGVEVEIVFLTGFRFKPTQKK